MKSKKKNAKWLQRPWRKCLSLCRICRIRRLVGGCMRHILAFYRKTSSKNQRQCKDLAKIGWNSRAPKCLRRVHEIRENSSFYDPFWSIAPLPIVLYLSFMSYEKDANLIKILVILIPVTYWSLRLTNNWRRSWKGLKHEDLIFINFNQNQGSLLHVPGKNAKNS